MRSLDFVAPMFRLLLTQMLVCGKQEKSHPTKFLDELSLIPPHVAQNGVGNFENLNEYVVKTRSRRDYTQLGYRFPNSFGAVMSKKQLKTSDFEVIFDFGLHDLGKGGKNAGFGFWLTDAMRNEAGFYGRDRAFNGVGAVIDLEGTPSIRFVDSTGVSKKGIPLREMVDGVYRIMFTKKQGILTVQAFINEKEHLVHTGKVRLPGRVHLGVTSFSGISSSTIQIERIIANQYLIGTRKLYSKGERNGRSVYIIVLGAAAILGLAYYLYQKSPKELDFKK